MFRGMFAALIVTGATFGFSGARSFEWKCGTDKCSSSNAPLGEVKPCGSELAALQGLKDRSCAADSTSLSDSVGGSMTCEASARLTPTTLALTLASASACKATVGGTKSCADCCSTAEACAACCGTTACFKDAAACAACCEKGACCEGKAKSGTTEKKAGACCEAGHEGKKK